MQLLDNFTSDRPQLSSLELFLLIASVLAAAASPVAFSDPAVGLRVAEVVAPAKERSPDLLCTIHKNKQVYVHFLCRKKTNRDYYAHCAYLLDYS